MEIKSLGTLKHYKDIPEWWISSFVTIPYFTYIEVVFIITDEPNEGKFAEDVEKAITNFLSLTEIDRLKISEYIINNYEDFVDSTGEKILPINYKQKIWEYVYPKEIFVSRRPYNDKKIYIQIMCECEWEEEHGLQIIYKEGLSLSRVSQQDGHLTYSDAYDLPDSEDRII